MADTDTPAKNDPPAEPPPSGSKAPLRLLSKIDGISTHFGEMRTGEELTTFDDKPLTAKQKRDFAAESEFLTLEGDD